MMEQIQFMIQHMSPEGHVEKTLDSFTEIEALREEE